MNDDLIYQRLRETAWRRKLTDAEQAELREWLGTHPDAQDDWKNEVALNELLARLPDVAVPSNFSARVLQAIGREAAAGEPEPAPRGAWAWRAFAPRFALVVIVIATSWFAYQWHARVERIKLAQSVAAVADVRSLPSPQFLEDFDAISRLPPMPPADDDLLALMK
jgi:anti-sigma factor RsiW